MARIETAPGQNARRKDRMAQYVSLRQEGIFISTSLLNRLYGAEDQCGGYQGFYKNSSVLCVNAGLFLTESPVKN